MIPFVESPDGLLLRLTEDFLFITLIYNIYAFLDNYHVSRNS